MMQVTRSWKTAAATIAACLVLAVAPGASAQNWPANPTPEWEALLAEARQEGQVILFGDPLLSDDFSRQFEADTGISVLFIVGTQNEKKIRFLRETEAQRASFDVFFSGTEALELVSKGLLLPVGPSLVLPEVTEGSIWREGKLHFIDAEAAYLPVPSQYVSGNLLVNTDLVDVETINSWRGLLDASLRGKIISHDPRVAGGGEKAAAFVLESLGPDFFRDLYLGQDILFSTDYRQVTDAVARGTHAVGIGALSRDILKYQNAGLTNLQVISPKDFPGYLVGGSAVPAIPSSAPNPKAAMVFVNWYLSQRGQQMHSIAYSLPSDRLDVPEGPWPQFMQPQMGVQYFNQFSQEWVLTRLEELRTQYEAILAAK